jgi:DNA repair protein RecO (recombination protein O)
MASEKTRAIVIRSVDFSESSAILTLFTEDFGKIGAMAKGARRPKSPFEGALDLLSLVRIVFLHKTSDALDLVTEAKLERRFRSAQRDLARLYAGYYVAELLTELTEPGDPHRELFHAADRALLALDENAPLLETMLRFELATLRLVGHLPSLDQCVVCGRPVESDKRVPFGMTSGGVLCEECRPGRRSVVGISPAVLAALRAAASDDKEDGVVVEGGVQGELRAVMSNYFAHLLGHRLKMSQYLGAGA